MIWIYFDYVTLSWKKIIFFSKALRIYTKALYNKF